MFVKITQNFLIIITNYSWYHRYKKIIQITGRSPLQLHQIQTGRRKVVWSDLTWNKDPVDFSKWLRSQLLWLINQVDTFMSKSFCVLLNDFWARLPITKWDLIQRSDAPVCPFQLVPNCVVLHICHYHRYL